MKARKAKKPVKARKARKKIRNARKAKLQPGAKRGRAAQSRADLTDLLAQVDFDFAGCW